MKQGCPFNQIDKKHITHKNGIVINRNSLTELLADYLLMDMNELARLSGNITIMAYKIIVLKPFVNYVEYYKDMSELYVYEEDDPVIELKTTEINLNKEEIFKDSKINNIEKECLQKIQGQKSNAVIVDLLPQKKESL